jgi:hypothetical protein
MVVNTESSNKPPPSEGLYVEASHAGCSRGLRATHRATRRPPGTPGGRLSLRVRDAILGGSLLLGSCITCTQQVQQRESQAGQMRDVSAEDGEDSKEERETDVSLKVPIKP